MKHVKYFFLELGWKPKSKNAIRHDIQIPLEEAFGVSL